MPTEGDAVTSVFAGLRVVGGRMDAIRQICRKYSPSLDQSTWDDRQWLAQTILNILDGAIDDQFKEAR